MATSIVLPEGPLSSRIANVSAIMAQAEAVLELIGQYGEDDPTKGSAYFGAATIIRSAIETLGEIEIEVRLSESVSRSRC